jgi:hypothetical protein
MQMVGWGAVPLFIATASALSQIYFYGLCYDLHTMQMVGWGAMTRCQVYVFHCVPIKHAQMVGWGAVPLLISLLGPSTRATPKCQTYVLATLMLLAMHEPRHADVVCRWGAWWAGMVTHVLFCSHISIHGHS